MVPPLLKTRKTKAEIVARDNMRSRRDDRNLEEAQATILDLQTQIYEINLKHEGDQGSQQSNQSSIKQLTQDLKVQTKKVTRLEEEISEANTAMSELKKSQTASSVDGRIDALKIELQEKVTSLKTADQNIIDLKAKITILEESSLLSNKLAEDMKEVEKQLEKQVEYAALLCKKVDDYKRLAEEQKPMAITSQTDGAGATKSTKEADSWQKQVEDSKVKSDKVKDDEREALLIKLDSSKEKVKEFENQHIAIRKILTRVQCNTNTTVLPLTKAVNHIVDDLVQLRDTEQENEAQEERIEELQEEVETLEESNRAAKELQKKSQDKLKAELEKARSQTIRIAQLQNELDLTKKATPKLPPSPAPSPKQDSKLVANNAKMVEEMNAMKKKLEVAKEANKFERTRADFAEEKLVELERKKRKELTLGEGKEKKELEMAKNETRVALTQTEEALAENRAMERAMETMKMEFEQEKKLLLVTRSAPRSDSGHNSVVNGGGDIVRLRTTIAKMASTMAGLHVTISELRDENTTLLLESLGI